MTRAGAVVYYLSGRPDGVAGAPASVEIPRICVTEADARSELGVVMMLSRMVHGDVVADATSWYLRAADISGVENGRDREPIYLGYSLRDNTMHAIAGGWSDSCAARQWRPFVAELERQRADSAGLPWSQDMLELLCPLDGTGVRRVEFSALRFRPLYTELLVRPVDICSMTEPLF